jgi:hypothetical protein
MKIIDIGICIDNQDPEGLGRIRYIRYSTSPGYIEGAIQNYTSWDRSDLFTAIPFLPTNINFIPEKGQTVKILNYDTDKETVNSEYIAGPFTTVHDFNAQTHSAQLNKTSYGVFAKDSASIFNKNGDYVNKKSEGSIAKTSDYAVYGKYGSDVIFTENGLQLRGGKLLSKKSASITNKVDMVTTPIMANKSSVLYLKKFDKKQEFKPDETTEKKIESKDLKAIIEYDVVNFDTTTGSIDFYVYLVGTFKNEDVRTYGGIYRTNNPELYSVPLLTGYTEQITNEVGTPTFTVSGPTNDVPTHILIRDTIKKIHTSLNLTDFDPTLPHALEDLHPFYFRPTNESKTRTLSSGDASNRTSIFNGVKVNNSIEHGLVYSETRFDPPMIEVKKTEMILKDSSENIEQSFSALKSDKIYFLSTDASVVSNKPIDFYKLDKYELTQENYLKDVEPNTYSMVRGENLINLLRSIIELLNGHHHNLMGPLVKGDPNYIKLMEIFKTVEDDILNKSIRIN